MMDASEQAMAFGIKIMEIVLDVSPGAPYVCNIRGQGILGLAYKVLFLVKDGRTLQEQIVYEGVDGSDKGQRYVCTLNDFAVKFTKVQVPEIPDLSTFRVANIEAASRAIDQGHLTLPTPVTGIRTVEEVTAVKEKAAGHIVEGSGA